MILRKHPGFHISILSLKTTYFISILLKGILVLLKRLHRGDQKHIKGDVFETQSYTDLRGGYNKTHHQHIYSST